MEEVYLNLKKMKKTKAKALIDIKNHWIRVEGVSMSVHSELPMIFPVRVTEKDIEKVFPGIINWKVTKMIDIEITVL